MIVLDLIILIDLVGRESLRDQVVTGGIDDPAQSNFN